MTDSDESIDELHERAEREFLEQPPDFDNLMPAQMSGRQFDHWCRLGKPPTRPMRRQAEQDELRDMAEKFSRNVDSLPRAPQDVAPEDRAFPFTPRTHERAMKPYLRHTGRYVKEQLDAAKAELRQEMRALKREALEEARAEIRRAMDNTNNVISLKELRRHG